MSVVKFDCSSPCYSVSLAQASRPENMAVFSTYSSNCTLPPNGASFVDSSDLRGTLDIIWSCASILLICTWSIMHQNLPVQSTPCNKKQAFTRELQRSLTKIQWMLFNLLAPEMLISQAISDRLSVKVHREMFQWWSERDGVEWTSTHSYFANMGGFVISFNGSQKGTTQPRDVEENAFPLERSTSTPPKLGLGSANPSVETSDANLSEKEVRMDSQGHDGAEYPSTPGDTQLSHVVDHTPRLADRVRADLERMSSEEFSEKSWEDSVARLSRQIGDINWSVDARHSVLVQKALQTVDHTHFKSEGERVRFAQSYRDWCRNLCALRGDVWSVDASQLLLARELGIISSLPNASTDSIQDRNKGDFIVKAVSITQIVWFVIQLTVRWYQQLPTTQLEITTLAFCLCSGITYCLLLEKPKDATSAIVVVAARRPETPQEMMRLALLGPVRSLGSYGPAGRQLRPCIPNDALHLGFDLEKQVEGSSPFIFAGWGAAVIVFGAAHCIAWGFEFPTATEQVLWQASSVVTIIAPVAVVLEHMGSRWVRGRLGAGDKNPPSFPLHMFVSHIVSWSVLLLYGAARIYVFVEAFRSLAFLPTAAYVTSWPSALPHIGG